MKTFRIALLPGDGVGLEVVPAAVRVLDAVESRTPGLKLAYQELSVGAAEYLRSGDPLPPATFERLREFDAILLGAMGLPGVRWPSGIEMTPQLDLRERLDLYCGLRPIYLFHSLDSPLRGRAAGSIDFVLVRESTEGLFVNRLRPPEHASGCVEDTMRITRAGAERVIRAAFRQALGRRKHLTLVDKANVLPSMAFFRMIFDEVAREFPEVATDRVYVDAAVAIPGAAAGSVRRDGDREHVRRHSLGPVRRAWWAAWEWRRRPTSATATRCSSRRTGPRRTSRERASRIRWRPFFRRP